LYLIEYIDIYIIDTYINVLYQHRRIYIYRCTTLIYLSCTMSATHNVSIDIYQCTISMDVCYFTILLYYIKHTVYLIHRYISMYHIVSIDIYQCTISTQYAWTYITLLYKTHRIYRNVLIYSVNPHIYTYVSMYYINQVSMDVVFLFYIKHCYLWTSVDLLYVTTYV